MSTLVQTETAEVTSLSVYPYRNSFVGVDGIIRPKQQSLSPSRIRVDASDGKQKLPSFGESSRKRKILYFTPDLFPWLNWWEPRIERTPFEVLSVKPVEFSLVFAATNLLAVSENKIWTVDTDYQHNPRLICIDWLRRQQFARQLVDADIDSRIQRGDPERQHDSLLRIASSTRIAWSTFAESKHLHSFEPEYRRSIRERESKHHRLGLAIVADQLWLKGWCDRAQGALRSRLCRRFYLPVKHAWRKANGTWVVHREPVSESGFCVHADPISNEYRVHDQIAHLREYLSTEDDLKFVWCQGRSKTRPLGRRKSRPEEWGEMGFAGRGGWSGGLRSGLPDRV